MCFSRIDTAERFNAEIASYKKASDLLMKGQTYVPIIGGVICGAALLALDLKTWLINKIFVQMQEQNSFAEKTYNFVDGENNSGTKRRIFSILNILTCGVVGLAFFFILMLIKIIDCWTSKLPMTTYDI